MNQQFLNRRKLAWSNYEIGAPTLDEWEQQQSGSGNSGKFWGFLNNLIDTAGNAYDEFGKKKDTTNKQTDTTKTQTIPVDMNKIATYAVIGLIVVVTLVVALRMLKR